MEDVYNWQERSRAILEAVGDWQSAPSKVVEKLGTMGKAYSVQRRLARFVDNARINWQG